MYLNTYAPTNLRTQGPTFHADSPNPTFIAYLFIQNAFTKLQAPSSRVWNGFPRRSSRRLALLSGPAEPPPWSSKSEPQWRPTWRTTTDRSSSPSWRGPRICGGAWLSRRRLCAANVITIPIISIISMTLLLLLLLLLLVLVLDQLPETRGTRQGHCGIPRGGWLQWMRQAMRHRTCRMYRLPCTHFHIITSATWLALPCDLTWCAALWLSV